MSLKTELIRGMTFGLGFLLVITASIGTIAYAANDGGMFGILLRKILVNQSFDASNDGTVKNALSLSGYTADKFQRVTAGQSCGAGQCMYGFDTSGNVLCR